MQYHVDPCRAWAYVGNVGGSGEIRFQPTEIFPSKGGDEPDF